MNVLVLMKPGDPSRQALTLARKFGEPHSLPMRAVEPFAPDALAAALARAVEELDAAAVFAAGTDRGNEVMARLAARLDLPLAANCIAAAPGNPATVTRLRWGGSLLEEARLHTPRPLITVAPHTVPADTGPSPEPIELGGPEEKDLAVRVVDHVAPQNGGVSLAAARVIVSGGRGVGSKEGFAIIEELALLLGARVVRSDGAALGRVHDLRARLEGSAESPGALEVTGLLVGKDGWRQRLMGAGREGRGGQDQESGLMDWSLLERVQDGVIRVSAGA